MYLWALRDAGLTEQALTAMRPDIDYEKALAECRRTALAGINVPPGASGEGRAYCLLAQEVARVLINLGRHDEALAWLERWKDNPNMYDAYRFADRAKALKASPPDRTSAELP